MAVIVTREVSDGCRLYRIHSLLNGNEYVFSVNDETGDMSLNSKRLDRPYEGLSALFFMENMISGIRTGEGFLSLDEATLLYKMVKEMKSNMEKSK